MTWVLALKLVLQLAIYVARRAREAQIESALVAELETLHGKHVDNAADARDRVTPGNLPSDRNPNQRD